jgi:hypothetical protein
MRRVCGVMNKLHTHRNSGTRLSGRQQGQHQGRSDDCYYEADPIL